MDIYNYIIDGIPIAVSSTTYDNRRFWNDHQQKRLQYRLSLQQQHNAPPLVCPITLKFLFYFPIKQNKKLQGCPYSISPTIDSLIVYMERVCTGILFRKGVTISTLYAKKLYDAHPRTELTMSTL